MRRELTALGVVALLLLAGCAGSAPGSGGETTPNQSTIAVAGSGSAAAEPNQAVVHVSVVSSAPDAATARQRLARNATRMRDALERIGVDDDQVTTVRYDIDQDYRRPREENGEPRVVYRAVHRFEITLAETDRVGNVVDTAVRNGATGIDRIEFTLSRERRRELEHSARNAAMTDARQKARSLADDANLTVTGVKVIRTTEVGAPRPAGGGVTATATPAPTAAPGSDIETGPVTVAVTVQVVYRAGPESDTGTPE